MPSVARAHDLQDRLLRALTELLDDGGSFSELSVATLIRAAGVSRSTFYVYFEDKPDLLIALSRPQLDALMVEAAPWLTLEGAVTLPALASGLESFVAGYVKRRVIIAALAEVAPHDARVKAFLYEGIGRLTTEITAHLERKQAAGHVRASLDCAAAAAWTAPMLERGLYRVAGPGTNVDVPARAHALAHVVFNMLYRG